MVMADTRRSNAPETIAIELPKGGRPWLLYRLLTWQRRYFLSQALSTDLFYFLDLDLESVTIIVEIQV